MAEKFVLAGATGDLGTRIARALSKRNGLNKWGVGVAGASAFFCEPSQFAASGVLLNCI
jgi:hypothetical protein